MELEKLAVKIKNIINFTHFTVYLSEIGPKFVGLSLESNPPMLALNINIFVCKLTGFLTQWDLLSNK